MIINDEMMLNTLNVVNQWKTCCGGLHFSSFFQVLFDYDYIFFFEIQAGVIVWSS